MKIAACVVTYNRKELLNKCLECLTNQTVKEFDIILVDNGSTDGTREMIEEKWNENSITYHNTGCNLGGAGGFHRLMKIALEQEYEYIWIMDDDTLAQETALESLLEADRILQGDYGFLSSAALWSDGNACIMNRQKIKEPWYGKLPLLKDGLLPVRMATFVSFFVKASVVMEVGLPIKEFFIWGDDVEYSQRIAKKYPCYIVGKSQVIHQTANNVGSNIAQDTPDRISRYKYAYRNEVYIARKSGAWAMLRQLAKIGYHCVRVLCSHNPCKFKKICVILGSSAKGFAFSPSIEYVSSNRKEG